MKNNSVELIGYYGSDEIHACSAWTSTNREINDEKRNRIPSLLNMLAEAGHHTPFEKSSLHFLVTSEIASHIHKLKHRIGVSINGESARYKELKDDKFYIPNDWPEIWQDKLKNHSEEGLKNYHECIASLVNEFNFDKKRAKESARYFLGYNTQIDCDVMFNWRSFYHFLELRNKPDAQKEIREIASEMLRLVKQIDGHPFKHTIDAFDL
jgi:thymidylate synthase (FAD)